MSNRPPFDHLSLSPTDLRDALREHFDIDRDVSTMSAGQKWNALIRLAGGVIISKDDAGHTHYDVSDKTRNRMFEVLNSMEWDEIMPAINLISKQLGISFLIFRICPGWMDFAQTYRHYLRCLI